jgi:hypothetical protein
MTRHGVWLDLIAPEGELAIVVHDNESPVLEKALRELVLELVDDCGQGLPLRQGDLEHIASHLEVLAGELRRTRSP